MFVLRNRQFINSCALQLCMYIFVYTYIPMYVLESRGLCSTSPHGLIFVYVVFTPCTIEKSCPKPCHVHNSQVTVTILQKRVRPFYHTSSRHLHVEMSPFSTCETLFHANRYVYAFAIVTKFVCMMRFLAAVSRCPLF